jgi:two-component system phosphate regulon response regulator PhoB
MVMERTIDVHIRALRRKLGHDAALIETVRGVGYRFRDTHAS